MSLFKTIRFSNKFEPLKKPIFSKVPKRILKIRNACFDFFLNKFVINRVFMKRHWSKYPQSSLTTINFNFLKLKFIDLFLEIYLEYKHKNKNDISCKIHIRFIMQHGFSTCPCVCEARCRLSLKIKKKWCDTSICVSILQEKWDTNDLFLQSCYIVK